MIEMQRAHVVVVEDKGLSSTFVEQQFEAIKVRHVM
jgi:hypothetical protein